MDDNVDPPIQEHLKYIEQSWEAVVIATNKGWLTVEQLNLSGSKIADYLYRGTPIQDESLLEIAEKIWNDMVPPPIDITPSSGLDNFPSTIPSVLPSFTNTQSENREVQSEANTNQEKSSESNDD